MATAKKIDNPNEKFKYETKSGESVELLPFERLPAGVFRKARKSDDEFGVMFDIIEAATDEDGLEVIDSLPLEELGELFEQWSEQAGSELPKH